MGKFCIKPFLSYTNTGSMVTFKKPDSWLKGLSLPDLYQIVTLSLGYTSHAKKKKRKKKKGFQYLVILTNWEEMLKKSHKTPCCWYLDFYQHTARHLYMGHGHSLWFISDGPLVWMEETWLRRLPCMAHRISNARSPNELLFCPVNGI